MMDQVRLSTGVGRILLAIMTVIGVIGTMSGCGGDNGKGPEEIDGWQVCFGEATTELGSDILRSGDGNYVVLGSKQWFGAGSFDAYLMRIQPTGNLRWWRTYGTEATEYGECLTETDDGGFLLAVSLNPSTNAGALEIIRTDSLGTKVWEQRYENAPGPTGMTLCSDGGAIMAGTCITQPDEDTVFAHIVKVDASGSLEWEHSDRSSPLVFSGGVIQTTDGGFLTAGSALPWEASYACGLIVKLDPSGNRVWARTIAREDHCFLTAVQQTADGGYFAAGYVCELHPEYQTLKCDLYVVKTDAQGYRMWERTIDYGDDEWFEDVCLAPDGGCVVVGTALIENHGYDVVLVKFNSSGTSVWERLIGGLGDDIGSACILSEDGGYVIAGGTTSYGNGALDVYVVKTDALGKTSERPNAVGVTAARLNPLADDAVLTKIQGLPRRMLLRR